MKYYIMAHVSGGATGERHAILKRSGEPILFDTMEEAEAAANERSVVALNERISNAGVGYFEKYPNARRWYTAHESES